MKALLVPTLDGGLDIELITETPEEREMLISGWNFESMTVSAEEWRDMSSGEKLK